MLKTRPRNSSRQAVDSPQSRVAPRKPAGGTRPRRSLLRAASSETMVSSQSPRDAALLKARAQAILRFEIAFIDNPEFRRPGVAQRIAADEMPAESAPRSPHAPHGTPAYYAAMYATPLLSAAEERDLFRGMNFLKHRANALRAEVDPERPDAKLIAEVEELLHAARELRDRIICANLRLVVSIARRLCDETGDFDELVSDGNITLMYAVEKFDYARGFRFSTYATHAIQRDFYRQKRRRRNDLARCLRGGDESIAAATDDDEADRHATEQFARYGRLLELIARELDEREQYVLAMRFGLDQNVGPQTLQMVGSSLGISKERVRQLELRAIGTLQKAIEPECSTGASQTVRTTASQT